MIVYMTPALNFNTDDNPLAYGVQIDSHPAVKVVPIPSEVPGGLPDGWSTLDGWVANSIITTPTNFSGVNPGAHTLKVITSLLCISLSLTEFGYRFRC